MSRGGRGRGRGTGSLPLDALGYKKGDILPTPTLQPPPPYPTRAFVPLPLRRTAVDDYLLNVKQEIATGLKLSRFYIHKAQKRKDIERYSDKYDSQNQSAASHDYSSWGKLLYLIFRDSCSKNSSMHTHTT